MHPKMRHLRRQTVTWLTVALVAVVLASGKLAGL